MNFLRNNIKVEFEKEEISAMEKTLGILRISRFNRTA